MPSKFYQARRPVRTLDPTPTANRAVGNTDGTNMIMRTVSAGTLEPGAYVRGATKIVAASNASASMLAMADYVCDGVADEVQINAALAALGSVGGTVLLSEGSFTIANQVLTTGAKQVIRGMGIGATTVTLVSASGLGASLGLIQLTADDCAISDLTINANLTGNASNTTMRCVHVHHATVPINRAKVERVRMIDTPHGVVTTATVACNNAVVRDCITEGFTGGGFYLRGAAGQPCVASSLTAKGGIGASSSGFVCDNGPVVLSDCHAIGGAGIGFQITSEPVALNQCTAQSNGTHGFNITGTRAQLIGCQAIGNSGNGFVVNATQPMLIGCRASGQSAADPNGNGFRIEGGSLFQLVGCSAFDNTYGFWQVDGTGLYQGCYSTNDTYHSWRIVGGTAHIQGCSQYGTTASWGFYITGGTDHTVDGCRIQNNGGHGVIFGSPVVNAQVTRNHIRDSGIAADNSYYQSFTDGDQVFFHANLYRATAGPPRAYGAIGIGSPASDCAIGLNDVYGGWLTAPFVVSGANARRVTKEQLSYVAATDLISGALVAGTWTDVGSAQTFRVDSPHSVVEIALMGSILCGGAGSSVSASAQTRLSIDSDAVTKVLGGEIEEGAATYQNGLSGTQKVKLQGLAVGNHTVKLQVRSNVAMSVYLRASSVSTQEYLQIKVTEYMR